MGCWRLYYIPLKNAIYHDKTQINSVLFLTLYVPGSCFRTLAVILLKIFSSLSTLPQGLLVNCFILWFQTETEPARLRSRQSSWNFYKPKTVLSPGLRKIESGTSEELRLHRITDAGSPSAKSATPEWCLRSVKNLRRRLRSQEHLKKGFTHTQVLEKGRADRGSRI